MSQSFVYSKRYSAQQGNITTPAKTDYMSISIKLSGKLETRLIPIKSVIDFQFIDIRKNGFKYSLGAGLLGVGTTTDPLRIDVDWFNKNYIQAKYWPFSQVGDPSESDLPMSGSYFSVTYPYGNYHYGSTAFAEGNGDLRILRHVTNGEDFRVAYCVWKNYRQTAANTIRVTDSIYKLPGLASNEYVHNVFPMSNQAMIAEVWVGLAFKEYVFINLNGTAIDQYHTFIRLGSTPHTLFPSLSGYSESDCHSIIRSVGLHAFMYSGRRFVALATNPSSANACAFQLATVDDAGTMTLSTGWTTTNTFNGKYTNQNNVIFANKLVSDVSTDTDRIFYRTSTDINITHTTEYSGPSPAMRFSFQEAPDGSIYVFLYMYSGVQYKNYTQTALKAQFTYVMDIPTKTVKPEQASGVNRNYTIAPNSTLDGHVTTGPFTYLATQDHYYARARSFMLLPTGDRLYLTAATVATDVTPQVGISRGSGSTLQDAADDSKFASATLSEIQALTATPPTVVLAGRSSSIVHRNVITTRSSVVETMTRTPFDVTRITNVSVNDRTYKALTAEGDGYTLINGNNLTNDRYTVSGIEPVIMGFLSKSNVAYYHNAMWGTDLLVGNKFVSSLEDNGTTIYGRGVFTCDQAVYTKMDSLANTAFVGNMPAGYTELHAFKWILVPAHHSFAPNLLFYKIHASFRVPDATQAQGYRFSSMYFSCGFCSGTISTETNGDRNISDVAINDISLLIANMTIFTSNSKMVNVNPRTVAGCAFQETDTQYVGLMMGGWNTGASVGLTGISNTNYAGYAARGFAQDKTSKIPKLYVNAAGAYSETGRPAVSSTLGLGIMTTTEAMGALYTFKQFDISTMAIYTTNIHPVMASARPASGFAITVSADIDVYSKGVAYTVPTQVFDLTQQGITYASTTVYLYISIVNGTATLRASNDKKTEHLNLIYIGYAITSATEITSLVAKSVSRIEVARSSVDPIGSAIPITNQYPKDIGTATAWANYLTVAGTGSEYLWGKNDVYDIDL